MTFLTLHGQIIEGLKLEALSCWGKPMLCNGADFGDTEMFLFLFFWCGGRNFLTFFSFKFLFFFFNWSLLALQNCVGFCQTSTWIIALSIKASQVAQVVKNFPAIQETRGGSPWVRKTLWKREWQPTSVFLLGKSHGEEPGGLQSVGLQRVSWTHTHLVCKVS